MPPACFLQYSLTKVVKCSSISSIPSCLKLFCLEWFLIPNSKLLWLNENTHPLWGSPCFSPSSNCFPLTYYSTLVSAILLNGCFSIGHSYAPLWLTEGKTFICLTFTFSMHSLYAVGFQYFWNKCRINFRTKTMRPTWFQWEETLAWTEGAGAVSWMSGKLCRMRKWCVYRKYKLEWKAQMHSLLWDFF